MNLMSKMEGTLWKWTNYFSGWQPRWFVLENGILSYYKSQEDVNNGCKGSIKMSVCDVNVHQTDTTRLDLIIPGEAHFYVKAATPQERQQWLVELGTCKACLTNGRPSSTSSFASQLSSSSLDEIPEDRVKSKKSELRLYCDLLMQQVHSVKTAVDDKSSPDIQQLNEATSLLSATCDTFIHTLDDCMKLTNASSPYDGSFNVAASLAKDIPPSPSHRSPSSRSVPWGGLSPVQRSTSVDSTSLHNGVVIDAGIVQGYVPSASTGHRTKPAKLQLFPRSRTNSEGSELSSGDLRLRLDTHGFHGNHKEKGSVSPSSLSPASNADRATEAADWDDRRIPTYISKMPLSFQDIHLHPDGGIPTPTFLAACKSVLPVLDKLNPTAFTPIRLDIAGNIRKIQQKYSMDIEKFSTLQNLVQHEMQYGEHSNQNSATTALLWLKRGLEFIREFLVQYLAGPEDVLTAANAAYTKTLKDYHSWVVRGVYTLAAKSAPTRKDFYLLLSLHSGDVENTCFMHSLRCDMEDYVTTTEVILRILCHYYSANGLDSEEKV